MHDDEGIFEYKYKDSHAWSKPYKLESEERLEEIENEKKNRMEY